MKRTFDTVAKKESELTAAEYLDLTERDRQNIKSITIVPPRLGDTHFGKFRVIYKTPLYCVPSK